MVHDFANQRAERTRRSAKPPTPAWIWFASGVVVGTFGSFVVYLATLAEPPQALAEAPAASAPAAEQAPAKQEKPGGKAGPAEKPQFDFYTILSESEVIVAERSAEASAPPPQAPEPAREPAKPETAKQATPQASPSPEAAPKPVEVPEPKPQMLMLQAGSFRQLADADRRRADITLLGYPARVESVTTRTGEAWHRVQVGPFSDAAALREARGALRDQGIETLEIGKRA